MMILESNLWSLLASFIFCYNILLFSFSLLSLFKNKKRKSEFKNWIYTLNTLLPFLCGIYFFSLFTELFTSWHGQNDYEWYAFSDIRGKYWMYFFLIKLLLPLLIGMVFFIKKLRLNFWVIFIYLVAAHFILIERLVMKMTRDYMPSTWQTYYDDSFTDIILQWILPVFLIVLTYFFLNKKNKLPYPSIFSNKHVQ